MLAGVADPTEKDETRIDRWLCAVRLVKTRPTATQLCDAGHVLVNGNTAKPSTKVQAGDRVDALIAGRERIVQAQRSTFFCATCQPRFRGRRFPELGLTGRLA